MNKSLLVATLSLSFAGLLFSGRAGAQSDRLNTLMERFDAYRTRGIQEKLFVHTDKPDYLAGEILWFKIYCVDASTHAPLELSKIAYVDLLDKDDKFVLQAKIAMQAAEGKGSFYLPLTFNSGNYKLRAYTNWMKNSGPGAFFEQPVTIINTLKELPAQTTPAADSADTAGSITFFPEGGDLLQDIRSLIAFRATDRQGRGLDCKGAVVDEHNDTVASFASLHFGIGRFTFTPLSGHDYKVLVSLPGGAHIVSGLPVARDKGYAMHIGDLSEAQVKITVRTRGPVLSDLYLFGRSGSSYRLGLRARLDRDSAVFLIPRDSLKEGITQLTLFNEDFQPVCERLVFVRPAQRMTIDVRTDKEEYATRRKINLEVSVGDQDKIRLAGEKGTGMPASLSLAVYRLDSMSIPSGMNMINYLWMSSDLKGRIDSPAYYFTATGPEADEAIDNLMLTHGWRRFHWEHHFRESPSAFAYPLEYSGHIITGRLTDMRTGAPLIHRVATISAPGVNYRFGAAVTDTAGKMVFDLNDFYGQAGIVIKTGLTADSPAKVDVFTPFSEQFGGEGLSSFTLPESIRQALLDRSLHMQVANVYSGDSLQRFRSPSEDTLHFFSHAENNYMLDDYTRFTTMEEVLREYVSEVSVNRLHGRLHVLMLNLPAHQFFNDDNPLVLLDGVPVPDDKIFVYDPLKIRKLEIVPRRYFLGPAFFSGIASFSTYKGDYEGLELDRHCTLLDYEGLQWQREFYSPKYETGQQQQARVPDFRNLLFWSPDIHLLGEEKKQYSFYTSDLPGTYLIVVQGLRADGQLGYKNARFEVR